MTDVSAPAADAASAAPTASIAAPVPHSPSPTRASSRSWVGTLVVGIAIALLVGVTAVLFVRVQDANDRADEAVTIARSQDALVARLDQLDTSLAAVESSGTATADDLQAARDQVGALRKCVNAALDGFAQATQTGKPVSLTKC